MESEDDADEAPKKRSSKKKGNATDSKSNKFELNADADDVVRVRGGGGEGLKGVSPS